MSRAHGELPRWPVDRANEKAWMKWLSSGKGRGYQARELLREVVRIQREIEKLEREREHLAEALDILAQERLYQEGGNASWPTGIAPRDMAPDEPWFAIAAEKSTHDHWRRVYARVVAYCTRK